ncbi:MAG: cold-shock protein [Acidimicrobiia bacterium]
MSWPPILSGVVDSFDAARGLGEIHADGAVYPFHCTQIADGSRHVEVGAPVEFTVAPGPRGRWEAVGIRPCR